MQKHYEIKISMKQTTEAQAWCKKYFNNRWYYDLGIFYFECENEAMAFKLKFDVVTRITMIDPPSGWRYGFPKIYNKKNEQTIEEWLIENGYPQQLIDQGMAKYCRYWEIDDEEYKHLNQGGYL